MFGHPQVFKAPVFALTRLPTVQLSFIRVSRCRAYPSLRVPPHKTFRPFPSALHPAVSSNAVEVRHAVLDSPSWNRTNIPMGFSETHLSAELQAHMLSLVANERENILVW